MRDEDGSGQPGVDVAAPDGYGEALRDIVGLLEQARSAAGRSVNAIMTATYWSVGRRIVTVEQDGQQRAEYGVELLNRLSADLTARFGRGFSARNLRQFRQFYLAWPRPQIWQKPSAKSPAIDARTPQPGAAAPADAASGDVLPVAAAFRLPWSAYVRLLSVKTEPARRFYETEALRNGWTVKQLDRQVNSMLYERIALSRNKQDMLVQAADTQPGDQVTPREAIRDPFVLEFLDLRDEYSETKLEEALVAHLAEFLLELGDDFAFIGRQRRMRIGDSWYRVDLVLLHRTLRSLLLVDLKIGKFTYADAGQMHLYLNYAKQNWVKPGENPPVGLILCADKDEDEARYALDGLPNPVLASEYRLVLPDEKALEAELARTRQAIELRARQRADAAPE
ncbi:MAG: PDDEXK nuclease domain-containing protein [Bifidobacteriaceae bacterium]|jgi:predicted nuclease of restriction endonuclease-like (RecB) superfamily|nr:PDDEXK nuclease domain-containing protein [Bifidobacteriaceae bacterium]